MLLSSGVHESISPNSIFMTNHDAVHFCLSGKAVNVGMTKDVEGEEDDDDDDDDVDNVNRGYEDDDDEDDVDVGKSASEMNVNEIYFIDTDSAVGSEVGSTVTKSTVANSINGGHYI